MERKTHLDKMGLINGLFSGKNLPESARKSAIEYARKLTTSAQLRTKVREWFKASLADRDISRAAQVIASSQGSSHIETPPSVNQQTPSTPGPEWTEADFLVILAAIGNQPSSVMLERYGLVDERDNKYTPKYKAYMKWYFNQRKGPSSVTPQKPIPSPAPETQLQALIPHLDFLSSFGETYVTFDRVPQDKRHLIEGLRTAGVIGKQNMLTGKGKAWLGPAAPSDATSPDQTEDAVQRSVPFCATEAGHDATQAYFNEFRKMPPEDFDLEGYWKAYIEQFRKRGA